MPWDLIARLLEVSTLVLEQVVVHSLRENTFIGSLQVRSGGARHEIDARPSDAITLALDAGAPIFVTEEVFNDRQVCVLRAGEEMTGLEVRHARALSEGKAEPEPAEKEWRSFRALPRHESTRVRQRVK